MTSKFDFGSKNEFLKERSVTFVELFNPAQNEVPQHLVLICTDRPRLVAVGANSTSQSPSPRRMKPITHMFDPLSLKTQSTPF
jgi:hypothetical protein